jgi:Uma2 family endonuclease
MTTVMSVSEVLETYAGSLRLLTAEEYCRLAEDGWFVDERVELLDGVVVQREMEGEDHRWAVDELNELLVVQLLGRYKVRVDGPFVASELSVPEPDVAVLDPRTRAGKAHPRRLEVAIEVSDSSLRHDLGWKARLYAAAGVPRYLVVDIAHREVLDHTEPSPAGYGRQQRCGSDAVLDVLDARVPVERLFPPPERSER